MEIAFIVEAFDDEAMVKHSPWYFHARELARSFDISIKLFYGWKDAWRPFDAMILMAWLDWANPGKFNAPRIMQNLEKYSEYRATFPETVQIALNHIDYTDKPYALPYWRAGDPILCRTPPYDRSLLAPFPAASIFPYELVWGTASFPSRPIKYAAGFVGYPSGPKGYRERVALETAKVGLGCCITERVSYEEYCQLMSECRILVCPQGWGSGSLRHWDAWRSGKPVLTDQRSHSLELIPGMQLKAGVHYLVYKDPAEIPDIVSDWTQPARRAELESVAERGREAAASYDACDQMRIFFNRLRTPPKASR